MKLLLMSCVCSKHMPYLPLVRRPSGTWLNACLKVQAVGKAGDTEMQRLRAELQQISAAAAQQEEAARQEVASIHNEAEQRQMQLAVIMETLEALQSGSDGQHNSSSLIHCSLLGIHCQAAGCLPTYIDCKATGWIPGPQETLTADTFYAFSCVQCAGALEQRVVTLTAELAASRQEHSDASQRAAELEQQLQEATTTAEQLRCDLEASQAASERAAASEGAARASEQAARQDLETCRSAHIRAGGPHSCCSQLRANAQHLRPSHCKSAAKGHVLFFS